MASIVMMLNCDVILLNFTTKLCNWFICVACSNIPSVGLIHEPEQKLRNDMIYRWLTHLHWTKRPQFRRRYFQMHFVGNEKFYVLIKISLTFFPESPIDNNLALVWIMAWRRRGDKPLSEPMLTRFTDTYMRHYGSWNASHMFRIRFDSSVL